MSETHTTVHEATYRALREIILFGGLLPGKAVTLRGLAEQLDVSPTPVREAVRRLIAERALHFKDNRRVSIPQMSEQRFKEIRLARMLIEPELAALAMPKIDKLCIAQLQQIDQRTDTALENGDIEGYMRSNYEFHFQIYRRTNSDVLLGLADSLWLQFGPFMRLVYGRMGTSSMEDQHRVAIVALQQNDAISFKNAIAQDIQQGMNFIEFNGAEKSELLS
ncbi:MAG: GntR family transcriptional regulator [Pseudomonadales bacterium]